MICVEACIIFIITVLYGVYISIRTAVHYSVCVGLAEAAVLNTHSQKLDVWGWAVPEGLRMKSGWDWGCGSWGGVLG